jgi:tetratricopeptide (TPR) repeat protein
LFDIQQDSNIFLIQGNKLFGQGNTAAALECYEEAILLDPTQPIYYGNACQCLIKLKKYVSGGKLRILTKISFLIFLQNDLIQIQGSYSLCR